MKLRYHIVYKETEFQHKYTLTGSQIWGVVLHHQKQRSDIGVMMQSQIDSWEVMNRGVV